MSNIHERAANQFLDCDREELKAYVKEVDPDFRVSNTDDEDIRAHLCGTLGLPYNKRAEANQAPLVEHQPKAAHINPLSRLADKYWVRRMPQLFAKPPWGGRRRLVRLRATETLKVGQVAVVNWDGWSIDIQPEHEVSIPYPHYEALKNTFVAQTSQPLVPGADGMLVPKFEMYKTPTFPFDDLGDDPETAHLPTSVVDWLQGEARARKFFEGESREALVQLRQMLTEQVIPRNELKHIENDELRLDVLTAIGLYDEALAFEQERMAQQA